MAGRSLCLFLPLTLAGCGGGGAELAAVKSAHSLLAEWAAVEGMAAAGRVPATYADEMRQEARQGLASDRPALKNRDATAAVDAVLSASAVSEPQLKSAADMLDAIEKSLEDR